MVSFSGDFPHDLLDLNDWRWQGPVKENGALGTEGDGRAISLPGDEADTEKIEKYRDDPWFVLVGEGEGAPYVRLRAPAKGSTTSTSARPTTRSELREMHFPDRNRKSSWDATRSTVHNLKVRLAVTQVMEKDGKASRVAVAQVHKTSEDGIIVYLDGESRKLRWKQDSVVQPDPLGAYTLGEYVDIGLSVHDGVCTIYVDDVARAEGKLTGQAAKTSYFKAGCYNQDNNRDDGYPRNSFNEVHVAAVKVQHDVPWASGGYDPIGPGIGATQGGEPKKPEPQVGGHGDKPSDLIEFAGPHQAWKLNLDVDSAGKHSGGKGHGRSDEKSASELAGGFVHPKHFEVTDDGRAVRFRAHLNGARTGDTGYPRTELREMKPRDPEKPEAWDITSGNDDLHRLVAEVKVTQAPSTPSHQGVVIGQIHDTGTPKVKGKDILEIIYDGKKNALGYRWLGSTKSERLIDKYVASADPEEGWFTYRVEVRSGTVQIAVDTGSGFEVKVTRTGVSEKDCYFKAGAYTQSSSDQDGARESDYGEALFRRIVVET